MTETASNQEIRVRAAVAIALVERLAHDLDKHTEQLRGLIEAEREAHNDQ